jgi:Cortical protein marker for cell polarity
MRFTSLLSPTARGWSGIFRLSLLLTAFAQSSGAVTFNAVPSTNLDFSQLGSVAFAGDFDGISLYEYEGQNENGFFTNGSQSIMAQYPDGSFGNLVTADASIKALCDFVMYDGTMAGVIAVGNFTSLGGMETIAVALINPNTSAITELTGLSGQVNALYCDQTTNAVYFGGSFKGANSTNAIAWIGTAGWTNLPFNGFNGPVNSITKAANGNIIFGGVFTGLGNASAPTTPNEQVINISSGNITSGSTTTTAGFNDPTNILCKTNGTDGPGNTWLLANNTPGYWRADFEFGFEPTMLRLWNTHQDGRGTKTWRYTAYPIDGIMNFTYIDPVTGMNSSCTSECPLSSNTSVPYQDFYFVNVIGMDGFQIDISAWYGNGGGLDGIELFENDIFAYAVQSFNEPTCANIQTASEATTTGQWSILPSGQAVQSEYLSVTLSGDPVDPSSASVVFYPDIKQSGNYSVNMYTPGCLQDNSCSLRGMINITGAISSSSGSFQTEIFQTNVYPKYDQIYFGYIEAASDSFRPSVTLAPSSGQNGPLTVVAHRVGFTLISPSSGGLNSLFEYDPSQAVINTADFANSTFDVAGTTIGNGAGVQALATVGNTTYVGGNFSVAAYDNIFAVNSSGTSSLAGGGLNAYVMTMFANGTLLYVGGNFTGTSKSNSTGLNNIAAYDTSANTWNALGAGVNGRVFNIVPLSLDFSGNPENVITITGNFDEILAFGSNQSIAVSGFAIWVPSYNNWLQNIDASTISLEGQLSASINVPTGGQLFAGSLSSETLSANGVVSISSGLGTLPLNIQQSQSQSSSSLSKRTASSQNVTGVVTGLYYENGGQNITVIGGHFTATDSSGATIYNLAFINGSNSDTVTGVGSQLSNDSTILALAVQNNTLYAGGVLTGTVNGNSIDGLISFNFLTASLNTQPSPLSGSSVAVYAISARPNSGEVYVGGSFSQAGSLDCPSVCVFNAGQWNRPWNETNLNGTGQVMLWTGDNSLVVGGSLTISGNEAYLVSYDAPSQAWSPFNGASAIPGPVTALTSATSDDSQLWVAGTATNGSTFLMQYDGSNWNSVGYLLGAGSIIRGLQVLSLTQNHDSTNLVPASQSLLLTGSLNVPGFGNASAVVYNGTTLQPYALTSSANGAGSISQIFFQNQNTFAIEGKPGPHPLNPCILS